MANEPMRKDAGIVTAYGAAVRGGYTGTYEDFCRQQANYAEYAQAVEEAKTAAVAAAGAASTSETNAGQSAGAAAQSATAAGQSAGAAAQSQTAAGESATAAAQSAGAAAQSATAAGQSAGAAAQSQTAAGESATAAGQAQTAAEGAATAAGQSKTAAESAAGRAEAAMESYAEMTAEAETLPAGSPATAALDRTGNHPVLMLGLPEGDQGDPGVSPTVTVTDITGGHRVTITDAEGAHSFDVMNGIDDTGAVDSVNGKTGTVVLDGRDLNVNNSESNPETIEEALGDVNRALNDKYTKPETGIPATDLADGVIPDISGKADEPTGTKAANKVYGLDNNLNPAWVEQSGGGGGSSEPHNYALDGTDLTTVFADADALFAAYSTEDYSKIHVGDYWPVTLNGDYWDYGNFTCPSGVTYYSDDALTTEAGVTAQSYDAECVADAQLPYGLKPYCTIKISNVTYYVNRTECFDHRVRTLSNAIVNFVVGGINQYWRYGDSGSDNFHNGRPHLLMEARDGLPHTLKMRKQNEAWEGTHIAEFTGDGTTAEFTINGTVGTIGYVWVEGVRKTYNTDYTYGSNKITFKSGKIPANNAAIQVEWMDAKAPWTGSALYNTFNDPDHGIINLIKTADLKLYNHIYKGPNAKGMRYYAETQNKTNQQSGVWEDRGVLFLPMEDEIWGRPIYSAASLNSSTQMQQWPIYGNGGRRQYAKGVGNNASRSYVWCASSNSVASFAYVTSGGIPYNNVAYNAYAAAPCFLLS